MTDVSLATFPLEKEQEVVTLMQKVAAEFAAIPVLMKSFYPLVGKITRLHLCAFWPTREIVAVELKG